MPHTLVPADELSARLTRLRLAMSQRDPAWSMMILDNKIDLYYLTGTMPDGALEMCIRDSRYRAQRLSAPRASRPT